MHNQIFKVIIIMSINCDTLLKLILILVMIPGTISIKHTFYSCVKTGMQTVRAVCCCVPLSTFSVLYLMLADINLCSIV